LDIKEILKSLVMQDIPSGNEIDNNMIIKNYFLQYCDNVIIDKLGNVIGLKRGLSSEYKVMLAAHMDEIALMVREIDNNGFIRFVLIGGVDQRILPAQQVIIHGKEEINGIIGNKPPHIQDTEDRKKAVEVDNLFIDTGLSAKEVKEKVSVGDFITFKKKPVELLNNYISSNALDDRAGIVVMLYVLEQLTKLKHYVDIYTVATVQEEVGLRGAIVSSYGVNPDIGIAIDVCHGNMPDTAEYETQKLGAGPALALGPNIHPKLFKQLKNIAEEYNIPYQLDPEPSSTGTDAWAIQITMDGIPTALVSIPLKYMHTTVETLCLDDIKTSGRLIALFIASLCKEFMEGLTCF